MFLCPFLWQCNPGSGVWRHRSQGTDVARGVETPNIPILSPVCGFSAGVCCHLLGTSSTTEPQLAVLELGLCRDQPQGHHPPQKPSPALAMKPDGSQAWSQHPPTSFHFSSPHTGATTAAGWTTTPRSASSHRSPRSATSARASATWSPTAPRKHSSPPALRGSPPTSERRRTRTARPSSPKPGNDGGWQGEGGFHRGEKALARQGAAVGLRGGRAGEGLGRAGGSAGSRDPVSLHRPFPPVPGWEKPCYYRFGLFKKQGKAAPDTPLPAKKPEHI